uniref:Uncharacterized protein n=1 Tax=Quercus lobata TaxID=97700 RepID=A0A7N2KMS7_QUELO
MEALYAKLYDKYTKLKKRKWSELDKLNKDQEVKFVTYVNAAEELIQHLKNENDQLRAQVDDLRSEVSSIRRTHGCGLWRSIHEGWESFSKHLSFVVGEGTRIRLWHDRWIGDNTLKDLYPKLYVCSAAKDACIFEVLWIPEGGIVRVWDLRFYRAFKDWELAASYSLL